MDEHVSHHGIKGQKWGIRRFQNRDGSLTSEGKKRYTVFVSGSSKTQDPDSPYYRKKLPSGIRRELRGHIRNKDSIVVGDAPGIDRQVQDYLNKKKYSNVTVYGPGKQVRYSANKKWKTRPIDASEYEEYSKEWLAKKDIAMTRVADIGLAVVLENGGAGATRRNVQRLIDSNKDVRVYELSSNRFRDSWIH